MLIWSKVSKIFYVLANLIVLPASVIPHIDLLSNISFTFSFFYLLRINILLSILVFFLLLLKNNASYRFYSLLKLKGDELSKSDDECVYLYAWCTLLRYFLIGIASKEIYLFIK